MPKSHLIRLLATVALLSIYVNICAQIETDGTLGEAKSLPLVAGPDGLEYKIDADLGQPHGGNLFHSFREFNIGHGEIATFSGPETITNIISRVTGGNSSNIDGKIKSTIHDADFYLINPAGIVFGRGASVLDVSGSFHVSTAGELRLADGGSFNAITPSSSLLTIAPPFAFGFLDNQSISPIKVDGSVLKVDEEGKEISLIGGEIRIEPNTSIDASVQYAELIAPSGRINLAAVAAKGTVTPIKVIDLKDESDFLKVDSLQKGNILVSASNVNTSGTQGGQIFIRAGQLVLEKNSLLHAHVEGGEKGSLIDIAVDRDMKITDSSEIAIRHQDGSTNHDSLINITAKNIEISGIDSLVLKDTLNNIDSLSEEELSKVGLSEPDVNFLRTSVDNLLRQENITFDDVVKELGKENVANKYRRPFLIPILSKISNGNSSNSNLAKAADIRIKTGNLTIDTGIIESFTEGSGKAGDLSITADKVTLQNFGYLNAAVGFDSNEGLENGGSGQGGNITVDARESISLSGFSTISVSTAPDTIGNAGEIFLKTPSLKLDDHADVNSFSDGTGNGGSVNIEANRFLLTGKSAIYTKAEQAIGGDINLTVHDYIASFNSEITAASRGNKPGDDGGNLTINKPERPLKILALSKSQLLANADQGHGGDINLQAKYRLGNRFKINEGLDFGEQDLNVINSSSKKGESYYGKIVFEAQNWEFTPLLSLQSTFDDFEFSTNRCETPKGTSKATLRFITTSRDILPIGPEDLRTYTIRLGNYY